jgi:uncharacterized protein YjbJ (UPF0337 family)
LGSLYFYWNIPLATGVQRSLPAAKTRPNKFIRREIQRMNSDQLQGKWKQLKGSAKMQWGKLTDSDLDYINGQVDVLVGKLQERYGYAKEDAQARADQWLKSENRNFEHSHQSQQAEPARAGAGREKIS